MIVSSETRYTSRGPKEVKSIRQHNRSPRKQSQSPQKRGPEQGPSLRDDNEQGQYNGMPDMDDPFIEPLKIRKTKVWNVEISHLLLIN